MTTEKYSFESWVYITEGCKAGKEFIDYIKNHEEYELLVNNGESESYAEQSVEQYLTDNYYDYLFKPMHELDIREFERKLKAVKDKEYLCIMNENELQWYADHRK